jgi:hypothetical protein
MTIEPAALPPFTAPTSRPEPSPPKSFPAGLQVAAFCATVLTYQNVRSVPVLEIHHFRRGLT